MARKMSGFRAAPRRAAFLLLALFSGLQLALLTLARTAESEVGLSPEAAEAAAGKLRQVREGSLGGHSFGSVRISEAEANSYLSYEMGPSLPAGVSNPRLKFQRNRPRGTAEVDFDKMRPAFSAPPSPFFDYLLRGVHTLDVEGTLHGSKGVGQFHLEAVRLDGIPVPRLVVEFLIEHYLKARYSNAAVDRPFRLPFSIEQLSVEDGSIVLVSRSPDRS